LLFAIAYALAYQYTGGFGESMPSPLWLPDSVLLCALLLVPGRLWALYLVTALAIRIIHGGVPLWFLTATYLNDCLKAAFSASILKRFIRGPVRLDNLKQFGIYIVTAVVGIPVLSALAGAAARLPLGDSFWRSFSQWYLGNATAALALTPTLLYWCQGGWRELKAHPFRFTLLMTSLVGSVYYTFFMSHTGFSPAILYAPVPVLILAATTFRPVGVSSAISLLALVSIVSAAEGEGPFFASAAHHSVLSMQLFLISMAAPMLFVAILITERQVVESELRRSHNQIHDLAGKLLSSQEDERRRIAQELHDDIGQRLALLSIGLDELNSGFSPEMKTERTVADSLLSDLQRLASDVRDLSHQLHSGNLEILGLEVALKSFCSSVSQHYRIMVDLQSVGMSRLPAAMNLCLFRVGQEAIINAIKHGKAKRIDVVLRMGKDHVSLTVRDDGTGFDLARPAQGLGLVSMHERLRFLGGRLEVKSRLGAGTELDAALPLVSDT
jgi:two-component system sensor histidine kinase UhpB